MIHYFLLLFIKSEKSFQGWKIDIEYLLTYSWALLSFSSRENETTRTSTMRIFWKKLIKIIIIIREKRKSGGIIFNAGFKCTFIFAFPNRWRWGKRANLIFFARAYLILPAQGHKLIWAYLEGPNWNFQSGNCRLALCPQHRRYYVISKEPQKQVLWF